MWRYRLPLPEMREARSLYNLQNFKRMAREYIKNFMAIILTIKINGKILERHKFLKPIQKENYSLNSSIFI